ncbi:MAG: FAD-binding oxidoreductase [Hyphomicrobiales bacterium]|nr:FAD-binding oxidoreductase [Hyphomicrobiales bacterium]
MNNGKASLRDALQRSLSGSVQFDAEANRQIGASLWNADVAPDVLALVECRSAADVQQAVRVASDYGALISTLGGGHDWAGRAAGRGSITVDLRQLKAVELNRDRSAVTIGGGTLIDHVLAGIPDDLAIVTGTISTVGVTGLTLGGGYGKLNSRFGLALDTMTRAEVVLADGSTVVASEQDDAELFWALRGGGGNFGVVTSITLAAHQLRHVLTGTIFVPLSSAKASLVGLQAILDDSGDELSVFSALMTVPSGDRGLILAPMWAGGERAGERALQTLSGLQGAQTLAQGWSTYRATYNKKFEETWPKGRGYRMDAHNIQRLDDTTAEALVECAKAFRSNADCVMLHDFHGACARVAPEATAFPVRSEHFNVQVVTQWSMDRPRDGEAALQSIEAVKEKLGPLAMRGGYTNILGPNESSRVRAFYGTAAQRLADVKRRYDPSDRFRFNTGRL